jgi:hypothetical protein
MSGLTHRNLRQTLSGAIPRQLNDILRQLQDSLRDLKGLNGEVELQDSVSILNQGLDSALKIFSESGLGGALSIAPFAEERTVALSRGSYRNAQGGWTATDPTSIIIALDSSGLLNLYRNDNLPIGGTFIPTLVGPLLPPGLGAPSSVLTITSNYVVEQGVTLILADASAGALTVTLPAVEEGRAIAIKKIDATLNIVTVEGDIDGDVNFDLLVEDESIEVIANPSEWWIV